MRARDRERQERYRRLAEEATRNWFRANPQPSPAGQQAGSPDDAQAVLAAFRRCDVHAHNLVAIADLKDATGIPLPRLHQAINHLRRQGVLTVAGYEGRHGADRRIMDASIRERDELLAFVMLRAN